MKYILRIRKPPCREKHAAFGKPAMFKHTPPTAFNVALSGTCMTTSNNSLAGTIPLILASVSCNAFAQILLKKGVISLGNFSFDASSLLSKILPLAMNPWIIAGLSSYVVSVGLWLLVLSRAEVSAAYPFLSVGYIIVALAGWYFFKESLTLIRLAGIALICIGVILIARPS